MNKTIPVTHHDKAQAAVVGTLPHMDQNHPCLEPPQSSHDTQELPRERDKVTDTITSLQKVTVTLPLTKQRWDMRKTNIRTWRLRLQPELP